MSARRARALTLAVVAGFALAAVPPIAAQAAPSAPTAVVAPAAKKATKRVAVTMSCTTFSTSVPWATTVATTYTKVAKGKKSKVSIAFSPNYRTGPVPITANSLRPVLSLKVNGKAKTVTGTANPTAVGVNTALPPSTITFKFKVKKGKNKIILSKVVWDHALVDTPCTMPAAVTLASFTKK
jgi:hypothetical protein